jgi:triphosphatase
MSATPAPAQSSSETEIEWQFAALDVRPVARWLMAPTVPGYQATPGSRKTLRDSYYDTADWRLQRAGYTCRIRQKGDTYEATLKSMAEAVDGLRHREEITEPVESPDADLASLPGAVGQTIRAASGRLPVTRLFTLETDRQTYELRDEHGELGEIALDITTIPVAAEDHPVRFSRVEVEVASVERAKPFVDAIVAECSLQPATTSKFGAALIATGQQVALPYQDLGPTELSADMTAANYACAVLRKHFATMVANEPGTRLGADPEYLHDMRVASRRIRATMSAFDPYLPIGLRRLRMEMGWLTRSLGDVRDLDVQLERIGEWRRELPHLPPHALDALEEMLTVRRDRARKRMLMSLDSRRTERLLARFAEALRRGPARTSTIGREPILAVAPALVEKRYKQVRKRGDAITPTSPPGDYHALRIQSKKLRYALEFVAPVYGKNASGFSSRVTALQELLGDHQDADVAIDALMQMATSHGRRLQPETLVAIGVVVERYRLQAEELRSRFPATYRRLRGEEWKLLRKRMDSRIPR